VVICDKISVFVINTDQFIAPKNVKHKKLTFRHLFYKAHTFVFLFFNGLYSYIFPRVNLEKVLRKQENRLVSGIDQTLRLEYILNDKINYLDVGARSGLPKHLITHKDFFNFYLCEPEREEAKLLESQGYNVIDKALYSKEGRERFYVTAKIGSSSLLKSSKLRTQFFRPWTSEIVDEYDVETTTVDDVERERNISFDYIKLDTQGSEMEILSGAKNTKALFITTEISMMQIYEGQKTFYDIVPNLNNRGYMIAEWSVSDYRPIDKKYRVPSRIRHRGIPLHGDIIFMPDWTSKKGVKLIQENDRKYAAIMLINGMEEILRLVLDTITTSNKDAILETLNNK